MVLAFDSSMWSRDRWISGEGTVEHPEVRQSFIPAINFFVFINCFLSVTLWENRKYIYWSLLPVPGTELLKPNDFLSDKNTRSTSLSGISFWPLFLTQGSWNSCNFLHDRRVFHLRRWQTLSGLLDGSWVRAGHWKDQAMIEAWNFQPYPNFLESSERGWKSSLCNEISTKFQK